ncbi:MAG: Aldehyde Dehydrogenase, partial [Rhizobacter sp.]|nr:Aldehyde Dehydrogenase [Rhizobacter sp.]
MIAAIASSPIAAEVAALLDRLGVPAAACTGGDLQVRSPITGDVIAAVPQTSPSQATAAIDRAQAAFKAWRLVPGPRRGELVRLLGEELRAAKVDLGRLVTLEVGKVSSEGEGEVQEMIDICDFAVGLSRQLNGSTIATERVEHRMMETWHPLGVCGVISAFNFPVAVWSWNATLALVCGDPVVWKPSEKTPLTAIATHAIAQRALARFGSAPEGLLELLIGGRAIGELLVDDRRIAVLSATGSTAMGRQVGPRLAARFARSILELGGNNAAIVAPSADLDLTLRGVAFAAMGTAGQRCTTLRRLFVHDSLYDAFVPRLAKVYAGVKVGDPRVAGNLVGPLIDEAAFDGMQKALMECRDAGGKVHGGERVPVAIAARVDGAQVADQKGAGGSGPNPNPAAKDVAAKDVAAEDATGKDAAASNAFYVRPALVELQAHEGPVKRETFAPILYVLRYSTFDEAIAMHNDVGAGLSSSIFTLDMR